MFLQFSSAFSHVGQVQKTGCTLCWMSVKGSFIIKVLGISKHHLPKNVFFTGPSFGLECHQQRFSLGAVITSRKFLLKCKDVPRGSCYPFSWCHKCLRKNWWAQGKTGRWSLGHKAYVRSKGQDVPRCRRGIKVIKSECHVVRLCYGRQVL